MIETRSAKKSATTVAGEEGVARPPGAKPQLLGYLPGSPFTSPGFIAAVVAIEFLYGVVLFAVMSSMTRDRPPVVYGPIAYEEPPIYIPKVAPVAPVTGKSGGERTSEAHRETKRDETRARKKRDELANGQATPSQEPGAARKDQAPGTPPKKKRRAPRKKAAPKTEVAVASTSNPEAPAPPPEPPKDIPTIPPLGSLIDPSRDCRVSRDDSGLTITVPGTLHVFDPTKDVKNAPRALTEVVGDFVATVRLPEAVRPGTTPLKNIPFTFQGAGLLVWQDKDNYLRFERSALYMGDDRVQQIRVETCKNGKTGPTKPAILRNDGPITLRLERKGAAFQFSYTSDGKTWIPVRESAINLAPTVEVGISASNVSSKTFRARFEDFVLKKSG